MGRKLQIILGLSLVMIFASSAVPADSNFSMFDLRQAFAQTDFDDPLEEGQVLVISGGAGFICNPFPGGERFGAIFEADRSNGDTTKIFDTCPHGPGGFGNLESGVEIDIAIDPDGRMYILDREWARFGISSTISEFGAVFQGVLPPTSGAFSSFSLLTSNFNLGADPIPFVPIALDTSSSGQVYVLGTEGNLIEVDVLGCPSGFDCSRSEVSNWFDSAQGPVWDEELWTTIPSIQRDDLIDVAFAEDPVGSSVHNIAYVVENHLFCTNRLPDDDPSFPNFCLSRENTGRVWEVDVTNGNREIINTFNDPNEGPVLLQSTLHVPLSIVVANSGNLLVSTSRGIFEIDPVTKNRTLFSDPSDANDGITGIIRRGLEVERSTGLIFALEFEDDPPTPDTKLIQIDPANGFRTSVNDLIFAFAPSDIFNLGPDDLAIVPAGVGPDTDNDGVPADQDPDDNDPCIPDPNSPACDTDGDGEPDSTDPDPNDPCNPNPSSPACTQPPDSDGDGVPDSTDPDPNDPCIPDPNSPTCDSDGDGLPTNQDPDPNDPCNPNPSSPACTQPRMPVGGEIIPLDSTMVLAAGAQSTAAWMIPVIVSAVGIAIVIARKF